MTKMMALVGRAARALLAPMLLAVAMPAHAEWLEASNKHFVIYGNVQPKRMAEFADRLNRYGAALRLMLNIGEAEGASSNRVVIYLVPNIGTVQKYMGKGSGNVAGFYRPDAQSSFIVAPLQTDGNEDFNEQLVLFHEYAHHVLLGYRSTLYPSWLSEGLAEMFATAKVLPTGDVTFGHADNARAEDILSDSAMSVEGLLQSDGKRLSDDEISQKYARGWLLTHYLILGGKRGDQLSEYLKLLAAGTSSVEAGRKAFGDLRKLNNEIDQYRSSRLTGRQVAAKLLVLDPVKTRALDAAEAAIMPIRLRSATGTDTKGANALLPDARRIAAQFPQSAFVQRALAEIEFDAGHDSEAEAAADRALAIDPANIMAMVYKARVHLRRATTAKPTDPALFREARQWIVKANRIDPDYALPLALFYSSFVMSGEAPRPSALDGLARAIELVPEDDSLRMMMFGAMLGNGDLKRARSAIITVAFAPHARADNPARKMIELIDSGADLETVRKAAGEAHMLGLAID